MAVPANSGWLDVPRPPRGAHFHTTSWSLVQRAGATPSPESRRALEDLFATYWFPLYAYLRRRGADAEEAADLVQGMLARILERRDLAGLDPGRGRFRAWLAAAARHHLVNHRERDDARKRGGAVHTFSLDAESAEVRLAGEFASGEDPERAYERAWGQALLAKTLHGLREDWHARGHGDLFEALRPTLENLDAMRPLAEIAAELDTTEGAVRTASWRLRRAYGERLRAEVAATLADPADVDDELRHLLLVLTG